MDALVNVLVGEVLTLHCHENGDCQEADDRHSERSRVGSKLLQSGDNFQSEHSRVSSELHCQEEGVQVVGWCHCLFVLETSRTGAMRVIHITVKTKETQRLRIKFVLCCPTCAFKHKQIYHSICQQVDDPGNKQIYHSPLSTSRLIKQQVDIATLGFKA